MAFEKTMKVLDLRSIKMGVLENFFDDNKRNFEILASTASWVASMASEADGENLDYRYLDLWEFGCLKPLLECIFALILTSSSSFSFLMPFFGRRTERWSKLTEEIFKTRIRLHGRFYEWMAKNRSMGLQFGH